MTCSASVLTITAFTVERYVAICHPIKAQTMSSLPRAIKTIVCIWVFACLCSLPYPIHAGTFYFVSYPGTVVPIPDSLQCNIRRKYLPRMMYIIQASTFVLFIVPMTIISVLYIRIGLTLRRSSIARRNTVTCGTPSAPHSQQSRRAVLKMLVAVVVAFFLCWAPFHAQRLMTTFIPDTMWTALLIEIQSILFYISGVLYFVSSTVNPILYNLMSRKYRRAFKDTLCRCCLPPERRMADRYGGYSDRYSNTYVTMAGSNSSRLISADRSPTRRIPPHSGRSATDPHAVTSSTDSDASRQKEKNGWGRTTWRTRLLPPNNHSNAVQTTANGQTYGGGCAKLRNSLGTPGSLAPASAPILKEEVEMTDISSADEKGGCQVIRMKEPMKGGTYL